MEYYKTDLNFSIKLRELGVSKLGRELIDYIREKTWYKSLKRNINKNNLDWININYRKINRECWKKNGSMEIRRALKNLIEKNIIQYDSKITKIRINYDIENWG